MPSAQDFSHLPAEFAIGGKSCVQFAEDVVSDAAPRAFADALGQRGVESAIDRLARAPRHVVIGGGFKCAIGLGGKGAVIIGARLDLAL